jgi:hypothetical protein
MLKMIVRFICIAKVYLSLTQRGREGDREGGRERDTERERRGGRERENTSVPAI